MATTAIGSSEDALARLLQRGKHAAALDMLEHTLARAVPLLATDVREVSGRRLAWLTRTQLLLEWRRPMEALAWTCLECELAAWPSERPGAQALRDRLLAELRTQGCLDDHARAAEAAWPEVAGLYALRAVLQREVVEARCYPEHAARYGAHAPAGIVFLGRPGCGQARLARALAAKLDGKVVDFGRVDKADSAELTARLDRTIAAGALAVAAATSAESLNPALLECGRLERSYALGLPDAAARLAIFQDYLRGRPQEGLDLEELVDKSREHTAAGIVVICERAMQLAERDGAVANWPVCLRQTNFLRAMMGYPPGIDAT